VALALAVNPALSQSTLLKVEGRVAKAGAPVPDAQVILIHSETGKTCKMKTAQDGSFSGTGFVRGSYLVEVFSASGEALYRKLHQLTGEGATPEKLILELSSRAARPESSAERAEVLRAQNARTARINALIAQSQSAINSKNWQAALPALQELLATDSSHWEYFQAIANTQTNLGDYENAVPNFQQGIQIAERQLSATAPTASGNPAADTARIKSAIGQMLNNQASVYLKLNKSSEAIAALTRAAGIDPNPGLAWFNLCATLYNIGNSEGALPACDKAIAADPNKAEAYFIKGSLLMAAIEMDKDGKLVPPPGAVEALKKYLELAPDGRHAIDVKQMLEFAGAKIETTYKPKKP